ncbi:OLC1v1001119C1 [Oldenlandia corymbosa var. corymbosa]|uniref:OLC1v1001119C1 n=1 Tax=Oldenlandia corymbosa var. corymbosa TaxID=529605 RepID=A0AAV1D679_OLDCO|nr:OLC1v1001119C1 [Oldenlandia corymbosa var. corymbosa]
MGSSQDMGSFDELEPIVILDEEDDLTPKAEPRLMVPKREKTEEEQEQFAKELNVGRSSSSTRPPLFDIISSKRLLDKMSTTETAAWLDVINNNEEEVLAPRTMKNECEVEDVTKPVPLGNEDDIGHEEKSSWEEDNNNMDASSNNGVEDPYFGTIQTTANVQRPLYELNANGNLVIESLYDDDDDASVSSDEYLIYDMKFIPSFYH